MERESVVADLAIASVCEDVFQNKVLFLLTVTWNNENRREQMLRGTSLIFGSTFFMKC